MPTYRWKCLSSTGGVCSEESIQHSNEIHLAEMTNHQQMSNILASVQLFKARLALRAINILWRHRRVKSLSIIDTTLQNSLGHYRLVWYDKKLRRQQEKCGGYCYVASLYNIRWGRRLRHARESACYTALRDAHRYSPTHHCSPRPSASASISYIVANIISAKSESILATSLRMILPAISAAYHAAGIWGTARRGNVTAVVIIDARRTA